MPINDGFRLQVCKNTERFHAGFRSWLSSGHELSSEDMLRGKVVLHGSWLPPRERAAPCLEATPRRHSVDGVCHERLESTPQSGRGRISPADEFSSPSGRCRPRRQASSRRTYVRSPSPTRRSRVLQEPRPHLASEEPRCRPGLLGGITRDPLSE